MRPDKPPAFEFLRPPVGKYEIKSNPRTFRTNLKRARAWLMSPTHQIWTLNEQWIESYKHKSDFGTVWSHPHFTRSTNPIPICPPNTKMVSGSVRQLLTSHYYLAIQHSHQYSWACISFSIVNPRMRTLKAYCSRHLIARVARCGRCIPPVKFIRKNRRFVDGRGLRHRDMREQAKGDCLI